MSSPQMMTMWGFFSAAPATAGATNAASIIAETAPFQMSLDRFTGISSLVGCAGNPSSVRRRSGRSEDLSRTKLRMSYLCSRESDPGQRLGGARNPTGIGHGDVVDVEGEGGCRIRLAQEGETPPPSPAIGVCVRALGS
jgi:hypothetical protein